MPKDDINYKFTENGIVYDFYDVFVPAENFRQPALWVQGGNSKGQLGTNDTTTRLTPVTTFAGGTNWKTVGSGSQHTLAIKTDGTLWTWGYNGYGGLGLNFSGPERSTPVTTFAGGNNWKSVAAGLQHSAAIKTDGTLWCWGESSRGQVGNGGAGANTPVTTFSGGTNWKQVACGEYFTAAVKTDGTLWTWGGNPEAYTRGQLGTNDTTRRNTPVTTFAGGTNWKQVACGSNHTVAVKTDGTLWVWGLNGDWQLGINDTNNRTTPVTTFVGGTDWKQVSTTAAIKTDGTLWTWGGTSRRTPVVAFSGATNWKSISGGAAIKTDGTIWNWSTGAVAFAGNNWKFGTSNGIIAAIQYQPDP